MTDMYYRPPTYLSRTDWHLGMYELPTGEQVKVRYTNAITRGDSSYPYHSYVWGQITGALPPNYRESTAGLPNALKRYDKVFLADQRVTDR